MAPTLLFCNTTVPDEVVAIPYNVTEVLVVLILKEIDSFPVSAPIKFPVVVPMFAAMDPATCMPAQVPSLLAQLIFFMVLSCISQAVPAELELI